MKKTCLILLGLLIGSLSFSQEICDNAIDDDGDGLVDLNDDECDCGDITVIDWDSNLVPNHSFEEMSCCPSGISDTDCVDDWHNVGYGTSDYLNHCDYWTIGVGPDYPLPSPGEGYVGFWPGEAMGCCLLSPLLAGETYLFSAQFSMESYWIEDPEMILSIFGGSECVDYIDENIYACETGVYWDLVARDTIMLLLDDSWAELSFYFTPATDYYSIAFMPCLSEGYYYMDDVFIGGDMTVGSSDITEIGSYCDGDLVLQASTDTAGGTWQWYLDGVALVGETSISIDAMLYGFGDYTAIYTVGDECIRSNHTLEDLEAMDANFEFSNACPGEIIDFTNTSVYGGEDTPGWEWDFGDGGTSTDENPGHMYTDPGTYTVELIGTVESGCNDTIAIDITINPAPIADFEFLIEGISSQDGATGGCLASPVQFNDLSTIADPDIIVSWDWDFGDGGSSDEENPEYTYGAAGTYTVTLTVETENGCTATTTLEIVMTESLALDLLFNEPTCFGFSDGSVTVNVIGGSGEFVFEITDELGDLRNEDNSNTANTLNSGWYYIDISDGTACSILDSIFLDQPDEMNADLTVTDPLCYGDASGWVRVDSVYNATGLYDQISFFWAPNPPNHEGLGADSLWDLYAGEYTLTINDENGCSKVFDFVVNQPDSMHFVEFGFEHAYCRMFGYQSGNGVVFGAAAGGTPDYTYLWENLDNGDTEITSTWGGLNPGNYRLTATEENGCVISREIFLDSLNPEAAFTVISDQLNDDCQGTAAVEVEFENNSINFYNHNDPFGDSTFFWNLNSPNGDWQLTHDYFYKPDTIYGQIGQTYDMEVCLVALNKNGCSDTVCKVITIFEPIAFEDINIFTPNGDGNNDVFTFEFRSASISEFHCVIVNRWGVVMKELNDITEGWDGTDQGGTPCQDGVYFYKYEATTDNSNILVGQGTIQLVSGN